MFFTTGRFMLSLALLFILVFLSPFSIVITSLGEERADLFILHSLISVLLLFSWCQGLAAACDIGTKIRHLDPLDGCACAFEE